ncbi:MAG: NapC/NirT family cytochrome c [Hyphomicrobiaceae bacterium]|nr:NapC/NirT family cytochrome c [Hyphomicrobiaceae bacterium]
MRKTTNIRERLCERLNKKFEVLSKKVRLFPLLALGIATLTGVVLWGGFNWSLELTNTESFCVSCHAMRDNVYKEYKKTIHFENRTGVRATCPDCHVPREWIHKVVRKIRATNELYHWLMGTIATREKFEARRPQLASHVWKSMKATDSRECRNCHGIAYMKLKVQTAKANKMHELADQWKMTCIDCHKGIAHSTPKTYSALKTMDKLHERMKAEKVNCRDCHKDMAGPPPGDGW